MRLPRDKGDMDAAEALCAAPSAALVPHINELLEWLQDMNWPVARPVAQALARCGVALVEPCRHVLHSSDDIWKLWVLHFVRDVDGRVVLALDAEIRRLRDAPTAGELAEDVPEAAAFLLAMELDNNGFLL